MKNILIGLIIGAGLVLGFQYVNKPALMGAIPSAGDFIGIYNATTTDLVLRDGYGSALAVDQNGRLITTSTSP